MTTEAYGPEDTPTRMRGNPLATGAHRQPHVWDARCDMTPFCTPEGLPHEQAKYAESIGASLTDESREALAQGPTDPLDALVEEILRTGSMSLMDDKRQAIRDVLVKALEMGREDAK